MGDVLWSDTTFEIAVAHLITTCHIRETDGEVWSALVFKMQFLTFPLGEFGAYSSLLQIG